MINFKSGIAPIILGCFSVIISSCKDVEYKESDVETQKVVEAIEEESEITPEFAKLVDRLENYLLTDYLTERDLRTISKAERKFQFYQIDLNNDGKEEIFIALQTSYFCGTGGCTLLLLSDELKLMTEFTVTKTPIYVEDSLENGWKTLIVQSEGKWRKLVYKDDSYPSNPSVVEVSSNSPTKDAKVIFGVEVNNLKTYSF